MHHGLVRRGSWVRALGLWAATFIACFGSAQEGRIELKDPPDEAINLFTAAANAQNAGEFELAADLWADFLKRFPDVKLTPQAEHYCGVCNLQLRRFDVAARHFEAVVKKWSQVPGLKVLEDAYLNLGWCQYSLAAKAAKPAEQYAAAAATFAQLIERYPQGKYVDQALYFLGESLYHQNKKTEAIAAYRRVVDDAKFQKSSLRASALYALGVTLEETGQYADAGKVYDQFIKEFAEHELATEIRMRKAETILQLGLADKKAGRKESAEQRIRQALQVFAETAGHEQFEQRDHALFQQALCLVELGQYADAAQLYARLAQQMPSSPYALDAMLNAGRFFYRTEAYDDALKWLLALVEKKTPSAVEAAHWACRIYLKQHQPAKAVALAEQVLKQAEGDEFEVHLKLDLADALFEIPDRRSESLAKYQEIVQQHPNHPLAAQALYYAAYTALDLKQFDQGLQLGASFLKQFPKDALLADVKYVMAECHLLKKDYQKAEALYRDLITNHARQPDLSQWQVRLGLALFLQEKYPETIRWLQPLIEQLKPAPVKAEALYLVGASHFRTGKFAEAAAALSASVETSSDWPQADEALLVWSQALHKAGKTREAIEVVQRLLREQPETPLGDQAHYRYAEYAFAAGDPETAEREYSAVIDRWPQSTLVPYALYGRGWSLLSRKSYQPAIASLSQLIDKYPQHPLVPDARLARGMCLRQTEKYGEAIADLDAFLKTNPQAEDRAAALYEKGLCQVALKDYRSAIASLTEAWQASPKGPIADRALYELAWAYKLSGDAAKALEHFRRLAADYPQSPLAAEAHFHDAEDLYERKQYEEAAAAYALAKQKATTPSLKEKAAYKLGWALYQQKKWNEALAEFQSQLKEFSGGELAADAKFMVGECLFRLERYAEALPVLLDVRSSLADAPANVQVTLLLHAAQSAIELKQYDQALPLLRTITSDYADSPLVAEAYLETGRALQAMKRIDDALAAYEQAALKSPGEVGARARFMMGEIYFDQKQFDQAIKQFQICIFGYGGSEAEPAVKNWQAKCGYEAARCSEVQINSAKNPQERAKLISDARKFYNYVVSQHPQHELAKLAKSRLDALMKLR